MSDVLLTHLQHCRARIAAAAGQRPVTLVAVSKTRPVQAIRTLARFGQLHFGENYVQEALSKIAGCADLDLVWHFIGPLQSNKCRDVAMQFDWVQSVDRLKLVEALARHRPSGRAPLDVLLQVNIDRSATKSGCAPDEIEGLAAAVAAEPRLRLRGLMAIPDPDTDTRTRRAGFNAMHSLYADIRNRFPLVDTLSIGMSDDYAEAIGSGATMVRIGSALFGPRQRDTRPAST